MTKKRLTLILIACICTLCGFAHSREAKYYCDMWPMLAPTASTYATLHDIDESSPSLTQPTTSCSNDTTENISYESSSTTQPTTTKKLVKKQRLVKKKRPFNSPRTNSIIGVSAGYVSKVWIFEGEDGEKYTTGIYDESWLHGIQFGLRFNPLFKYGFGIDTGLYYEYYHNKSAQLIGEDESGEYYYYQTLNLHVLRLPIHMEYRLNFSRNFQVFVFGGIAAEYTVAGHMQYMLQGYIEPFEINKDIYGTIIPATERFNLSASFGGGIRLGAIQFNVNSQIGLLNTINEKDIFLRQNNPLGFTLSIMF